MPVQFIRVLQYSSLCIVLEEQCTEFCKVHLELTAELNKKGALIIAAETRYGG